MQLYFNKPVKKIIEKQGNKEIIINSMVNKIVWQAYLIIVIDLNYQKF